MEIEKEEEKWKANLVGAKGEEWKLHGSRHGSETASFCSWRKLGNPSNARFRVSEKTEFPETMKKTMVAVSGMETDSGVWYRMMRISLRRKRDCKVEQRKTHWIEIS